MPDEFLAIDWIKGFYDVLNEQISKNVERARDVINFSTGFLGVVGAGAAYMISQHPDWCQTQRLIFILASASAFVSFFAAVLLAFFYIRAHGHVKFFPLLPKGITLFTDITKENTQDFEQLRYDAYKQLIDRGPEIKPLYTWAFVLMLAGFAFYGNAAALLIVFQIGVH